MPGLSWDQEAEKELKKVPFFVRSLVRRKVEERVQRRNGVRVSLADFKEAEERFRSVMAGKSSSELQAMMPIENQPGVEMVLIETCHNKLSNCPNVLIETDEWKKAIEEWVRESRLSEKFRQRVKGEKIYFHQKFRISISGCPNGCSRPQIAEVGLMGFVRPEHSPENCNFCGSCEKVCPDLAIRVEGSPPEFDLQACLGCKRCFQACEKKCIKLSEPGVRLMLGGKLGRHPHLGEIVGEFQSPADLISTLDRLVWDFFANSKEEERFSDFWIRANKKGEKI